jgi:hypothetical protein
MIAARELIAIATPGKGTFSIIQQMANYQRHKCADQCCYQP